MLSRGNLIKWISHHNAFEASGDVVRGIDPIYRHGIVIEVSATKKTAIVAHCFDCEKATLVILDSEYDDIQRISGD